MSRISAENLGHWECPKNVPAENVPKPLGQRDKNDPLGTKGMSHLKPAPTRRHTPIWDIGTFYSNRWVFIGGMLCMYRGVCA